MKGVGCIFTLMFVSVFCGDITIVSDYGLGEIHKDWIDDIGEYSSGGTVLMGVSENCSDFRLQKNIEPNSIVIGRSEKDIGRVCSFTEMNVEEDMSMVNIDMDSIYQRYSGGFEKSKYGSILLAGNSNLFDVRLLVANGDLDYSISWILSVLNSVRVGKQSLYILLVNSISFKNEYVKEMYKNVLDSNQIIRVISTGGSNTSENVLTFLPSPYVQKLNVEIDGLEITLKYSQYDDKTLRQEEQKIQYNFLENEVCDFPVCYANCIGAPSADSVCLSSTLDIFRGVSTIRHFRFPPSGCVRSRKRRSVYPNWFISYLISIGHAKNDLSIIDTFEGTGSMVLLNPAYYSLFDGVNYLGSSCEALDSMEPILATKTTKISVYKKSGERLPSTDLSLCYHAIVTSPSTKCLRSNVKLVEENKFEHTTMANETRRKFVSSLGETKFQFVPLEVLSTTEIPPTTTADNVTDASPSE